MKIPEGVQDILPELVLGLMRVAEALLGPKKGRKKKKMVLRATRRSLDEILDEVDLPHVDGEIEEAIEDATVEALIDQLAELHFPSKRRRKKKKKKKQQKASEPSDG